MPQTMPNCSPILPIKTTKLLLRLRARPRPPRNDLQPIIAEGIWRDNGRQKQPAQTASGYDPHFYLAEHGCTAAELDPEIKMPKATAPKLCVNC